MSGERHGVVADQHQVGVSGAAPRRAHLVQDAGVVFAVRQGQQALAHHSSTVAKGDRILLIVHEFFKIFKNDMSKTCV